MVPTTGLNSAQHKVLKKLQSIIGAYGVREHSLTEYSCKIKHVFTSKKQNMRLTNCNFFPYLHCQLVHFSNQIRIRKRLKKQTVASNFNNSQ